jgi:putative tricarboxylic transport membrane protein
MPRNALRVTVTTVALALAASACGATSGGSTDSAGASGSAGKPLTGLRLMVPNSPGGGYDVTARTAAKVMEDAKIANSMEVFNLSGAGGTVGLARLVNEKGNGDLAMMMGLGVVGATYTNKATSKLSGTTPIARLIEEPSGIMVAKDSPYQTLDDLVKAWKANPGKVSVGGGSSPGGPDHLLPMQLAAAVGIDAKKVNFVSYDGGGDLLPAILGNKLGFATSGTGEYLDQIKSGAVRVLATTGAERLPSVDAKTLKEQGVDLVFTNWRGIVAPPGISEADKKVWIDAYSKMHETKAWKDEEAKRGWTDAFQTGADFDAFLKQQDQDVADLLKSLGLA